MSRSFIKPIMRTTVAISCILLMPYAGSLALGDTYGPMSANQVMPQGGAAIPLNREQLENLAAPIALYPDGLLGQILAASTYPLEIVEAGQWLQQNSGLQGPALIAAARQQDWDPSVQVLVGFPDALSLLTRDIRWTTDLGNAFLSQQGDLMGAIQDLRYRASANGRLVSTPQQVVSTEAENGQTAITIQPANPQIVYVPVYNPVYVWGPPAWGAYPALGYPAVYGYGGYGYGFGAGINIGALFSGLIGWGGWGWVLGWFTHTLSLAGLFFNLLGLHGFGGGYHGGGFAPVAWAHNPVHRLGVPYASAALAARYGGARPLAAGTVRRASARMPAESWQHFGASNASPLSSRGFRQASAPERAPYRSAGLSGPTAAWRTTAPAPRAAAPSQASRSFAPERPAQMRTAQQYSAAGLGSPKFSAPKFSEPKFSGPKMASAKAPRVKAPKNNGGGSGKHRR